MTLDRQTWHANLMGESQGQHLVLQYCKCRTSKGPSACGVGKRPTQIRETGLVLRGRNSRKLLVARVWYQTIVRSRLAAPRAPLRL